jgi:carbon storage regulator
MLVLTRKNNESIMIGGEIELTILSLEGDRVRLGIKAPSNIEIHRKELYLSIQEENNKATKSLNLFNKKEISKKLSDLIKQK